MVNYVFIHSILASKEINHRIMQSYEVQIEFIWKAVKHVHH